jgi:eukaryotic-like serine/threonine-protein kinase
VDQVAGSFELAWSRVADGAPQPRIEDYLAGLTETKHQHLLLQKLLIAELNWRLKFSDPWSPEEYEARFPSQLSEIKGILDAATARKRAPRQETNIPTVSYPTAGAVPQLSGSGTGLSVEVSSQVGITLRNTDRFEIERKIGAGAMGIVYQAFDRTLGSRVALKLLPRIEAMAIHRFKQEFRALADVVHPNLVRLYDFFVEEGRWFFTMELLDGVNFLAYSRPSFAVQSTVSTTDDPSPTEPSLPLRVSDSTARTERDTFAIAVHDDMDRLRDSFRQLTQGLCVLHDAGKLHRDVKPSNVIVTKEGRVVLLDVGLAVDLDEQGVHEATEYQLAGTVAYMSPEQGHSRSLSAASDWYSVGVMLYQALTGQLPFRGTMLEIMQAKEHLPPPTPRNLVPSLPNDLTELCMDLLRRRPDERPSGRDILHRLGVSDEPSRRVLTSLVKPDRVKLVGREQHLTVLDQAFSEVKQGRAASVLIHGISGIGKSALVQRFLDAVTERQDAVVLCGRCYERESVPFKGLDNLVDALCRYLRHLERMEAEALMPRDVWALARVFPVLERVEAVEKAPRRAFEIPDQQELRRRAFAALRELLTRLGDRAPLILHIDDLQWSDVDSAMLLLDLLRPPDPPPLLLLASYRTEDATTSPFLQLLLRSPEKSGSMLGRREIELKPLTDAESRNLAAVLLDQMAPERKDHADAIAKEAGGNPFFIGELARFVGVDRQFLDGPFASEHVALEDVIWTRANQLPATERRLLEVIAVAGQPIARSDALLAAELSGEQRGALDALRAAHLVRTRGLSDHEEIETYHDRIRETVVTRLSPLALECIHQRLALTLERSDSDPEAVASHFLAAGLIERAAKYYALAAARAASALAFERAAKLFRLALQHGSAEQANARELRVLLGDALANAGRGAEAAQEYFVAATVATGAERLELQRRAAMQLLFSGHVDKGLAAIRSVLAGINTSLPRTPRRALWSFLFRSALLRLRGLRFRERSAEQVSAEELSRVDILWSATIGLTMVDIINAMDFQKRQLLLALRAGEPFRIARALAIEVFHTATAGRTAKRRTETLIEFANALGQRVAHPNVTGLLTLAAGTAAFLEGRYLQARQLCAQAESTFRDRCTGVAWELNTAQAFWHWSLYWLGELAELVRRFPQLLKEAEERGDLYSISTNLIIADQIALLTADDPNEARRRLSEFVCKRSQQGFHLQHYLGMIGRWNIELYSENGAVAWKDINGHWKALVRSNMLRVQQMRIHVLFLRACGALAAASQTSTPAPILQAAEWAARRLESEKMTWSQPLALIARAGIAVCRGDKARAVGLLRSAASQFQAHDMGLCAAVARRRCGELIGGDEGQAHIDAANFWMTKQGIKNPTQMAALFAPGYGQ